MSQALDQTTSLSPEQIAELRSLAERSLFFFARGVLGLDWLDAGIHGPICSILEDDNKRDVLIVLPRGWQKSTLVSICYPIWKVLKHENRNKTFCIVQNTASNAHAKLTSLSQTLRKPMVQLLFPDLQPTKDCTWKQGAYQIPRDSVRPEATFESAGRDTDLTGRHYDEIIKDDLIAPDESSMSALNVVPSRRDVEQAIGFHKSIIPILDPSNYRSIDVGTRWLVKDYIAYHLAQSDQYFKETGKRRLTVYMRAVKENGLGEPDPEGQLTFPQRFNQDVLDRLRYEMGSYLYSCLYMNTPRSSEDQVFKPEWFQGEALYNVEPKSLIVFTTVDLVPDPSESSGKNLDSCAVVTTGLEPSTGRKFVLKITKKRMGQSEQINSIFEHVREFSPVVVGIGAVGAEKNLKYWILEKMRLSNVYFTIKLLKLGTHSDAKRIRITQLVPLFEHGMIKIRFTHRALVEEALAFPDPTAHDDVLDALSMQMGLWQNVKIEGKRPETRDENPLSMSAGMDEILKRNQRSEGFYSDLLSTESQFQLN